MQELPTEKRCLARLIKEVLRLTDKRHWGEKSSLHTEFIVPPSLSVWEQATSVGIG